MADIVAVRPVDLLFDGENPRLAKPNLGQRDLLRAVASLHQRKLLALVKDILTKGTNPGDLPFVMPEKRNSKRYIVLEGNRRLAALRALENPESLVGAVDDVVLKQLRESSREYQERPEEYVNCVEVKDRDEARHWIELRHTGENQGAGIVPWGSDESSRFRSRTGRTEVHIQALDFLEQHGLTPAVRKKVPATSLRRLLSTPEVRTKLGIDVDGGELKLLGSEKDVAKALLWVAKDLADRNTKVADIYHKKDRIAYAKRLPASIVVTKASGTKGGEGTGKSAAKSRAAKNKGPRKTLIPRDCVLAVTDARAEDIEAELRKMHIDEFPHGFPNAVAVLFRVFLELSVDAYVDKHGLTPANEKLRTKMQAVLSDLLKATKLTEQQARPVRRALNKDSFLAPSIDLMNDYVHNSSVFPAPGDLRAHWNSLQPFMVAIWSA